MYNEKQKPHVPNGIGQQGAHRQVDNLGAGTFGRRVGDAIGHHDLFQVAVGNQLERLS